MYLRCPNQRLDDHTIRHYPVPCASNWAPTRGASWFELSALESAALVIPDPVRVHDDGRKGSGSGAHGTAHGRGPGRRDVCSTRSPGSALAALVGLLMLGIVPAFQAHPLDPTLGRQLGPGRRARTLVVFSRPGRPDQTRGPYYHDSPSGHRSNLRYCSFPRRWLAGPRRLCTRFARRYRRDDGVDLPRRRTRSRAGLVGYFRTLGGGGAPDSRRRDRQAVEAFFTASRNLVLGAIATPAQVAYYGGGDKDQRAWAGSC